MLQAHYDARISPELFADERARIGRERTAAEFELERLNVDHSQLLTTLDSAPFLANDIHAACLAANDEAHRTLNQAIFDWINVERGVEIECRTTELFSMLTKPTEPPKSAHIAKCRDANENSH